MFVDKMQPCTAFFVVGISFLPAKENNEAGVPGKKSFKFGFSHV